MDTINTAFANNIDFWMSFGIGTGVGIAAVSLFSTIRDVMKKMREQRDREREGGRKESLWATPQTGRGDFPMWLALGGYVVLSLALIGVCYWLLKDSRIDKVGLLCFLFIFVFIYNPFITYVNARLLGIAGQRVDIPFIKETAFILSGAKGLFSNA